MVCAVSGWHYYMPWLAHMLSILLNVYAAPRLQSIMCHAGQCSQKEFSGHCIFSIALYWRSTDRLATGHWLGGGYWLGKGTVTCLHTFMLPRLFAGSWQQFSAVHCLPWPRAPGGCIMRRAPAWCTPTSRVRAGGFFMYCAWHVRDATLLQIQAAHS